MEEYPTNQREFGLWFRSERSCLDYLGRIRWPGGFTCPRCRSIRYWVVARGLRRCQKCDHQASVTAGTIFHRTRTPLRKWFRAIWRLTDPDQPITAVGLQKALGIGSYRTAWAWVHKLRAAMAAANMPGTPVKLGRPPKHKPKVPPKPPPQSAGRASRRRAAHDRGLMFCRLLEQAVATEPVVCKSIRSPRAKRK